MVRPENRGPRPALVQTWLDAGDRHSSPATASAPFSVSPPIFRIEPHQQQALRLRYAGESLPADRKACSAQRSGNTAAVRRCRATQPDRVVVPHPLARVFPAIGTALPGRPRAGKTAMELVAQGWALQATNPTPYHVSRVDRAARRQTVHANTAANDS
jgi:chaperone protein EcpD